MIALAISLIGFNACGLCVTQCGALVQLIGSFGCNEASDMLGILRLLRLLLTRYIRLLIIGRLLLLLLVIRIGRRRIAITLALLMIRRQAVPSLGAGLQLQIGAIDGTHRRHLTILNEQLAGIVGHLTILRPGPGGDAGQQQRLQGANVAYQLQRRGRERENE